MKTIQVPMKKIEDFLMFLDITEIATIEYDIKDRIGIYKVTAPDNVVNAYLEECGE